ncbi:MAG TPA: M23 family metallopeptidase [Stellaceae bacterium]|nr:M23 family metallopeptidase [Stellaceae bacterium]
MLGLTGACIGAAAIGYLAIGYNAKSRLIGEQEAILARVERANAALQDELARLQDRSDETSRILSEAKQRLAALTAEAQTRLQQQRSNLQQQVAASQAAVASLNARIAEWQRTMPQSAPQRAAATAQIGKMEAELRTETQRQQQLAAALAQIEKRLQQVSFYSDWPAQGAESPPPSADAERQSAPAPADRAAAAGAAAPAPAAAPQPMPPKAAAVEGGKLVELQRVLASAGVDVGHIFAQFGTRRGEGGPFIPAPNGQTPTTTLTPEKLALLQHLLKSLPLTAPIGDYEIESPFGLRRDPFNGRTAFHSGLDLGGVPFMTPVHATAAGVVTYSGYRGDYGKMVEIDHGNGLHTRYGHLHRCLVAVGQKVEAHAVVGLLGSTGRATGPHVHYEVLVNGEPQNPAKFIGLERLVPAAVK